MTCQQCGGFIGEPGKAYGYAGKWCHCPKAALKPVSPTTGQIVKDWPEKCPPHDWGRDGENCVKCGTKDWMT